MSLKKKNFQAHPSPGNPARMQITYEMEDSRRVHELPSMEAREGEPDPHGAGSFHDPEHHQELMDRVEAMLREGR